MKSIAVVFPGQGSQRPGMGLAWRGHPAHGLWARASEILGWDVARLGHEADAGELRTPLACQVGLFVHHAVLLGAWRDRSDVRLVAAAGHSLGEYSALLAAGVLSFPDAIRLVETRATLTQEAAERSPGGMVACVGLDGAEVEEAARLAGAHVANDNAPGQVVVAGAPQSLERLEALLDGRRGRTVRLDVSAAYHSSLVSAAVPPFRATLASVPFSDAAVPVVANVDASAHVDAGDWQDLLARQLTAPVRWRESVLALSALGVEEVVELAATPVLSPMVKRIVPGLSRRCVADPSDLQMATVTR